MFCTSLCTLHPTISRTPCSPGLLDRPTTLPRPEALNEHAGPFRDFAIKKKKQLKATANVLLPRSLCTCERQPAGHLSRRHVEFRSDRCCEPALVPRPQPDRRRPDPSPPHALRCQRGPLSDPGSDRTSKTPQHFCKHLCPHCVVTETCHHRDVSSRRRVITEMCHHGDMSLAKAITPSHLWVLYIQRSRVRSGLCSPAPVTSLLLLPGLCDEAPRACRVLVQTGPSSVCLRRRT